MPAMSSTPAAPVPSASQDWSARPPAAVLRWGVFFFVATALAIVVLDAPLARLLDRWVPAAFWAKLLLLLEWPALLQLDKRVYLIGPIELNATRWAFALLLGAITLTSLAVPRFRPAARAWAFVFFTHLLARLAMVEIKEATERLRPSEWLAAGGGPTFWVKGGLSFPSGHVTYFLSLLLPAAVVFPRWRAPLLAIVALVAACRVAENAHFASDVTGAVALVCLVCFAVAAALPRSSWPWAWRRAS
jgi:membrane-associated phospholipid phosphatase